MVGTFLVFFALFATVIYPNAAMLHPTAWYATRLTDAPLGAITLAALQLRAAQGERLWTAHLVAQCQNCWLRIRTDRHPPQCLSQLR